MSAAPKLAAPTQRIPLEPADILTPKQLSKRLKVAVSWVYKNVEKENNPLPVLRCGGYLRFDWSAVVAWLRSKGQ